MAITFAALREGQRKERDSPQLQLLPPNFFEEVNEYFKDKSSLAAEAATREGSFGEQLAHSHKEELQNAATILKDLIDRRTRKILMLGWEAATTNGIVDTSSMAHGERELFDSVHDLVKKAESEVKKVQAKVAKAKPMVEFLDDVAAFVGSDMTTYGPFAKGASAELPEKNVHLLVSKGKARQLS